MRIVILFLGFLLASPTVFASASGPFTLPTHQTEAGSKHITTTKKKKKLKEKLTQLLIKKLQKRAKRKAKKLGVAQPMAEFADVAALAGAIVCIVGIISIISSLVGGILVALAGLLVYVLARNAGGSINGVFA